MKRLVLMLATGFLCSSCAFIFYNYRGVLDTEFAIAGNGDSTVRCQAAGLIYRLSARADLYKRFKAPACDSLYFYGPDYHYFRFKLYEKNDSTRIRFRYSGYHGFRRRPPHRAFIQAITDSLTLRFGARQLVFKDISNERKRNAPAPR